MAFNLYKMIYDLHTNPKLSKQEREEDAIFMLRAGRGEKILIDKFGWSFNGGYNRGPDAVSKSKRKKIELKIIADNCSLPTVMGFRKPGVNVLIIYVAPNQIIGIDESKPFIEIPSSDFDQWDDGYAIMGNGKFILPKDIRSHITKKGEIDNRSETEKIKYIRSHLRSFEEIDQKY